ncbi:MAG: PPC domain-containing protein, partial [Aggregatilineales bacterium]
ECERRRWEDHRGQRSTAPGCRGAAATRRIDNFVAQETGVYIVVASRYGEAAGDTVGNFILSVYEGPFSGIGNNSIMPEDIAPDQPLTGEITNNQPQRFYRFSAREDDVIDILMARTSGSLDAYLILQDMNGRTLFQDDDSGGGKNAAINGFRIPADGSYIIIAQRFEGANGSTTGGYRLTLRNRGDAYAGVNIGIPRLLYGTTVPDAISDADPDSVYAFYGMRGEVVTITMTRTSGNLDPVLVLLDQNQQRLISDDDSGGNSNAAITRYTLPYTGVYYINARRYEGSRGTRNSEGTFNVVLVRVAPAPGGS